MSIRLGPSPEIEAPAFRALVAAVRDVVRRSRFGTLDDLGRALPGHPDKRRLSAIANGTRFPEPHELHALVNACEPRAWPRIEQLFRTAAAERAAASAQPQPSLGDRVVVTERHRLPVVGEFTGWETLGVHRPITRLASGEDLTSAVDAGAMPSYVLRDKDQTELRPMLAAMAAGVGPSVRLMLITGESSAGKTRAAVEAMRVELAAWRLLIPYSADRLRQVLDDHLDLRYTVIWLDEIQDLLKQSDGPEQLLRLLALKAGPTVLLATLRSDAEAALKGTIGWRLLDRRAHRVALRRRPTGIELERAGELADPWIIEALDRIGNRYGIAEWLAAGPQLARHLDRVRTSTIAMERIGAAIVDAAVHCYHAGYTSPIPEALLYEVHHLHLEDPSGRTSRDAFTECLNWAREPVAGASGMLEYHRGRGDRAFDYLLGEAARPGTSLGDTRIWSVLLRHATQFTLPGIAISAQRNGQPHVVDELVRRCDPSKNVALRYSLGDDHWLAERADVGDVNAAMRLVELLADRGDVERLRARADAGHNAAAGYLAKLLAERGDVDQLARRADAGDPAAAGRLILVLAECGDVDQLARRADAGDGGAAYHLVEVLAERGDVDQLARRADADDVHAACQLARLLAEGGNTDTAITLLRRFDEAGDDAATQELAALLAAAGDVDQLARRADAGDDAATQELAGLLAARGDVDQLATRADAGDDAATQELAGLLTFRGDVDQLARRADAGDDVAASHLAKLLAKRGDVDQLARRAATGNWHATRRLVEVLAERGDVDQLTRRANASNRYAAERLAKLLAEWGDIDQLARRADAGDGYAAGELATLLAARGDVDQLARCADRGDFGAVQLLARLLAERGDVDPLAWRADAGDGFAGVELADLLAARGDVDQLARRAEAGDTQAAWRLDVLLAGADARDIDTPRPPAEFITRDNRRNPG